MFPSPSESFAVYVHFGIDGDKFGGLERDNAARVAVPRARSDTTLDVTFHNVWRSDKLSHAASPISLFKRSRAVIMLQWKNKLGTSAIYIFLEQVPFVLPNFRSIRVLRLMNEDPVTKLKAAQMALPIHQYNRIFVALTVRRCHGRVLVNFTSPIGVVGRGANGEITLYLAFLPRWTSKVLMSFSRRRGASSPPWV